MKKFLLHDPTTIGHHLIYAENFIDWALSRKFHVYFSGNGVTKTCFYQKFKNNPHVTFITFTMSGKDSRRFYKNNGPYVQVQHIKKLQKKIYIIFLNLFSPPKVNMEQD